MNEKQETLLRILVFVALVWLVMIITPKIFPVPDPVPAPQTTATTDSASQVPSTGQQVSPGAATGGASVAAPAQTTDSTTVRAASLPVDTTVVRDSLVAYRFSNQGASASSVELLRHRKLGSDSGEVEILRPGEALLRFRLHLGRDTTDLTNRVFTVDSVVGAGGQLESLRYTTPLDNAAAGGSANFWVQYNFVPNSYMVRVSGGIDGAAPPASYLVIEMPTGLHSNEANLQEDLTHYAVAYKRDRGDVTGISFGKLQPRDTIRSDANARVSWVAVKSKYFIVAVLQPDGQPGFVQVETVGGARLERTATHVRTHVIEDLSDGAFQFDLYSGPQEFKRLVAAGRDFQNSNPYGGFLQPIVQPFAVLVMKALLWLRNVTDLNYGWVLIIFGVLVRVLLWPLNQKAMRTTMRMQRLQPELTALQEKHKGNPQKLQEEMMRVYRDHGMTPFSPLAGCLPMLIPMPVLFALFFVFQNTIEFRGVSFLWLPDISLKDPTYIVPIFMGLSMYVMSWMGSRNSPPNPQMKMMTYMLPVIFTVLFLNFASGLNLYYAVQNVAALPQQWLIARERSKAGLNNPSPPKALTPTKVAATKKTKAEQRK